MRIGYGRVFTRDQHPEAQHDALSPAGCDQIFLDTAAGKLARRPELDNALLAANRAGDRACHHQARSPRTLPRAFDRPSALLQGRGVDLVVLDQGIDTSTAIGRLFFQIIGAVAEFEYALLSERTRDGLAAARARGCTGGQKPKLGPRQVKLARQMYAAGARHGRRGHVIDRLTQRLTDSTTSAQDKQRVVVEVPAGQPRLPALRALERLDGPTGVLPIRAAASACSPSVSLRLVVVVTDTGAPFPLGWGPAPAGPQGLSCGLEHGWLAMDRPVRRSVADPHTVPHEPTVARLP